MPTASASLVAAIAKQYPAKDYATAGLRAAAVYQEPIFACPTYWMVQSFAASGKLAYRGWWDVGTALHAQDVAYDFGNGPAGLQSPTTFDNWVGFASSFIRYGDPNVINLHGKANPKFPVYSNSAPKEKHFSINAQNVSTPTVVKVDPKILARCK